MIEHAELTDLGSRVDKYLRTNAKKLDRELDYFRGLRLKFAVQQAAQAIGPDGKMLSHQRRLGAETCEEAATRLLECLSEIERCSDFTELLNLIEEVTEPIEGFGVLAQYDTALRIGARLDTPQKNMMPTVVYLHAGTRKGAKSLGFDVNQDFLTMEEIGDQHPELLRLEKPDYIESFFCWCLHH